MDAVNQQRPVVEQSPFLETLQRRCAKRELRDLKVKAVLRDVDVAPATVGAAPRGLVQRVIREREAGMEAKGASNPSVIPLVVDEGQVLDQTGDRLVVSVAVRNLVTQQRRETGLGDDPGNG